MEVIMVSEEDSLEEQITSQGMRIPPELEPSELGRSLHLPHPKDIRVNGSQIREM